ncbi:hypothetical protein EIP86_000800 [Pleurotus ostreatoroseus]|nr:hypothetical protein EIP86_000800 [Pleurotus ostreatoroseus]
MLFQLVDVFKVDALDILIEAREKERDWYEAKIRPTAYAETLAEAVRDHYETHIRPNTKQAVFADRVGADGRVTGTVVTSFKDSEPTRKLYERVRGEVLAYGAAACTLVRNKHLAAKAKASAKKALKDAADVEMGDDTSSNKELESLKKELKDLRKSMASLSTKDSKGKGKATSSTQQPGQKGKAAAKPQERQRKQGQAQAAAKKASSSGKKPANGGNRRK